MGFGIINIWGPEFTEGIILDIKIAITMLLFFAIFTICEFWSFELVNVIIFPINPAFLYGVPTNGYRNIGNSGAVTFPYPLSISRTVGLFVSGTLFGRIIFNSCQIRRIISKIISSGTVSALTGKVFGSARIGKFSIGSGKNKTPLLFAGINSIHSVILLRREKYIIWSILYLVGSGNTIFLLSDGGCYLRLRKLTKLRIIRLNITGNGKLILPAFVKNVLFGQYIIIL